MLNVTFRQKKIELCGYIIRIGPVPAQCRSYPEWESKIVAQHKSEAIEAAIEYILIYMRMIDNKPAPYPPKILYHIILYQFLNKYINSIKPMFNVTLGIIDSLTDNVVISRTLVVSTISRELSIDSCNICITTGERYSRR